MKKHFTRIGIAALAALALCLSAPAAAQMGGGMGGGGNGGGMGGGMGSGNGDMGSMGMSGDMGGMDRVLVTPEGIAITVVRKSAAGQATPSTLQIVALSSSGSVLWRWDASASVHQLELAGDLVLVSQATTGMNTGSTMTPTGSLVALRSSSGVEAWRYTPEGIVGNIEVSSDRIYALVVKATGSTGNGGHMGSGGSTGSQMSRSLVVLDIQGRVLWSFSLDV